MFKSVFFGTGSKPCEPQGWHFEILFIDNIDPLNKPCSFNDLTEYSEHVGKYLHECPVIGLKKYWYIFISLIKIFVKIFKL